MAFEWQLIGWHDDVDGLLVEEAKRFTDQDERMRLYQQADQMLIEKLPIGQPSRCRQRAGRLTSP